ncbi:hypothetical protein LTR84_001690 [Exophiala bonariae]|uniref:Vacuolar ATPase assembly protein VMA22 n=1 Tax=Exophiala bonariae TaxID=1690606 RepID=A0AAV9NBC8_9EURO|nr:hypothetical protein LTR84_001690 [Exophiala bonariae]
MAAAAPSSYPSPPSSRTSSPSPTAEQAGPSDGQIGPGRTGSPSDKDTSLSNLLDSLLESYLDLLDTYTTLRAQLSTDFSSGFLSLAQANRTSTLGPGRRYGEEGYDERMKASKLLQIKSKSSGEHDPRRMGRKATAIKPVNHPAEQRRDHEKHKHTDIVDAMQDDHDRNEKDGKDRLPNGPSDQTDPVSSLRQLPSHHPPSHPLTYTITSVPPPTNEDSDKDASLPKPKSSDPLRWYGILIPPHLRQCQVCFNTSTTSTIPDLISTMSSMAALENDIRLLRQEMGFLNEQTYVDIQEQPTT